MSNTYYVYVYIDPRNLEAFYYGKGTGLRKYAHLDDTGDSDKVKRIKAIRKEGLEPIIKVIANNLSNDEALLVEKTLIWKLGKTLTNISSGHFSEKFRPHNTLHKDLPGFDFDNDVLFMNVGEGPHRNWEDCVMYSYLSAGQGVNWSKQLDRINVGDVIVPYLKGRGYVGIGIVRSGPIPSKEFTYNGKSIYELSFKASSVLENSDNEKSEFMIHVEWINTLKREDALWKSNFGLFSTQLVCASLSNQPKTIEFLENKLSISFKDLLESISKSNSKEAA